MNDPDEKEHLPDFPPDSPFIEWGEEEQPEEAPEVEEPIWGLNRFECGGWAEAHSKTQTNSHDGGAIPPRSTV